jgi:hypothetical protein
MRAIKPIELISTGKLQSFGAPAQDIAAIFHTHTQPINVVVFHGSQGILVFRLVSRLDAFSGYPFRT